MYRLEVPLYRNEIEEINSETKIIGDIRLWHLIGLCVGGLTILVIACCCVCKCRIPRTRQQIEEERMQELRKFDRLLSANTNSDYRSRRQSFRRDTYSSKRKSSAQPSLSRSVILSRANDETCESTLSTEVKVPL